MPITVRPAAREDLEAIREIYNEAVLNTTATYACEPESAADRETWFDEKAAAGYPVLAAEDEDGRVVGWAALGGFRGRHGYRFTAEDSVYVAADRRGCGIGRQLLTALLDEGRRMGLHCIVAGIDSEGEASIRLHESCGFGRAGHLREVGFKFGRRLDVVFLQIVLGESRER